MRTENFRNLPDGAYSVASFEWPKKKKTQHQSTLPPFSEERFVEERFYRLLEEFQEAIDGTELLCETIDKVRGKNSPYEKQVISEELMAGLIREMKKQPDELVCKLRIQHLLGQYLLISASFHHFDRADRDSLATISDSVGMLLEYVRKANPDIIQELCNLLGVNKKMLLLAMIAETQKPSHTDWPDMLPLLERVEAWATRHTPDTQLDKLLAQFC